ncbi:hypothetical protein KVT40_000832 [Elsinoe batatas]|uniref:Oxidoreductase-like domain-containing protein n=1 Tax=Elsinoe batatas TaxID=2601811 RepID=A0A8K0LA22_9PEZI|nr:hypothetical protein KVT40_000832 [Elsinoe batatas]
MTPNMRTIVARSFGCAGSLLDLHTGNPLRSLNPSVLVNRTIRPGFQRRHRNTKADPTQKIPLEGYYADILWRPSRSTSDPKPPSPVAASTTTAQVTSKSASATPSTPSTSSPAQPAPVSERESVEARARVVFGSRLAGPERKRELDKGATYIAGVKIPARPEEPDNCCMSGCVNCVWDLYRDELEEWAAANAEAKAKLVAMRAEKQEVAGAGGVGQQREGRDEVMGEGLSTGIGKVPTHVAVSMDDDGGGSETNWTLNSGEDDLFGGIPVGIREFMRTEKMLKQRHAGEKSLGA